MDKREQKRIREEKRKIRVRTGVLMDKYCDGCTRAPLYPGSIQKDISYCHKKCDVGKELRRLGKMLDGEIMLEVEEVTKQEGKRTTVEWDVLCDKAVKMKEKGKSYIAIAEMLGVNVKHLNNQMWKRGLTVKQQKSQDKEIDTVNINTPQSPEQPLKTENNESDKVVEVIKDKETTQNSPVTSKVGFNEIFDLQKENYELRKQLDECVMRIGDTYVKCVRIEEDKLNAMNAELELLRNRVSQMQQYHDECQDNYETLKADNNHWIQQYSDVNEVVSVKDSEIATLQSIVNELRSNLTFNEQQRFKLITKYNAATEFISVLLQE